VVVQSVNKPYFGVTGPGCPEDIELLVKLFEENHFNLEGTHVPMVGILVSQKTVDLGFNPGSRRYPPLLDIPKLLESTNNKTFNTIHFNTKRPEVLHEVVGKILSLKDNYDRGFSHGIQLNIAWPPTEELDIIKSEYPKLKSILQLSRRAIEGLQLKEIVERVKTYSNLEYLLIDPSCGKGLSLNLGDSSRLFTIFKENGVKATIGFAGGFSGENVAGVIETLKRELGTDEFCLDAEGNLREKRGKAYHDDYLSPKKVSKYVEEAAKAFSLPS
jgi:hypothetical protein